MPAQQAHCRLAHADGLVLWREHEQQVLGEGHSKMCKGLGSRTQHGRAHRRHLQAVASKPASPPPAARAPPLAARSRCPAPACPPAPPAGAWAGRGVPLGSGLTARSCQQHSWAPRLIIWNNFAAARQASKQSHRLSPQQQPLTSPSALTALARVVEAWATGFRQSSSHCSMEARARPSPDCRAPGK